MIGAAGPPRVSIVTVTYNSQGELADLLDSLERQTIPLELLLVDNASTDASAEMIRSYDDAHENVEAICSDENLGLAWGNNRILGRAKGQFVLILNPDTMLRPDALELIARYLDEHPEVSIVGPRNLYGDGTPHQSYHSGWNLFHVIWWRIVPYGFSKRMADRFARYQEHEVAFVSGACLMIRKNLFETIGGYDEEYFLTIEDVADLCLRARRLGGKVMYYPDAEVIHHSGRSADSAPLLVNWTGLNGTVYYFTKHHGALAGIFITSLFLFGYAVRSALALLMLPFRSDMAGKLRNYGRLSRRIILENPVLRRRKEGSP